MPESAYRLKISTEWPYRFTFYVAVERVAPHMIDVDGVEIVDALAQAAERQRARLQGSDYSEPREPFTVAAIPHYTVAIAFDARAFDSFRIRNEAASILFTLRREIERAQEVPNE
ncbi:hypothetical protein HDG32_003363 [Paraburkholderia sp. CI2]|uniref:hypothetical protein n=1 Tax=Paraburkholderia sp. CI2 TaxID=2723093 RepID=UPI001617E9C9|nr:hypothetical protein [Paraburkholderia sp. CI2]MBB5467243.1 hypothetical protein [Paraburkholderia sp. CI2]